ncbi:MAG: amidohydrolase [Gemmatimonadota bacterium]|nr:amidohydrolase [Gemmatimonadota bacterium]
MTRRWTRGVALVSAAILAAGCATTRSQTREEAATADSVEIRRSLAGTPQGAWESTYTPLPSRPVLITGATIMTAAGEELEDADLLIEDGKIAAIGHDLATPAGVETIDATGRWITPGIIDTHSHLGVYPDPEVAAHSEGNEATDPTTPEVWAIHSVWPNDPGFTRALAGGVTTLQILPGSANLIGGRGVTVHPIPSRTAQEMMFPDAPMALKMACGENPKRVYHDRGPSTRMGNWAGYRKAFIDAVDYREKWDEWIENGGEKPDRDLGLETLAQVLRGEILVHNHCYRSDDMVNMINLSEEFGFDVRSFHHAVEAYKIRDYLAERGIGASMWVDWWGFKMEAYDMVPQNIGLVSEAGAPAILHTDSDIGVQIMNQDAARAMALARAAGIEVTRDEALRWITAVPAWALGIEDETGTLEVGKNGDVVIWSDDPFSVYAHADQVFIDGALVYDRIAGLVPRTDFETGILPPGFRVGTEGGSR